NGDDYGRTGHELDQLAEERPLAVHVVEALGFLARKMGLPQSDELEAPLFDALQNGARSALFDGVRLYDAKGTFERHASTSWFKRQGERLGEGVKRATTRLVMKA